MQRLMTLVNKMANSQDEKVREVARIVANIISHVLVFFLIAPCPPKSENKNTKIFEWSGKTKPALNWPFHTKEYFGWCCKKTPCITEMKSFLRSGTLGWSWRSCQDPTGTRGQSSLPNFIDALCRLIYFVVSINHIQSNYQSNIVEVCTRSEVDQIEAYGELRLRNAS